MIRQTTAPNKMIVPPQRRYWPPSGVAKIRQKNPRMKIMPRKPPCLPAERSVGFRPKFPAPPSGSAKMIRQTTAPNKMIVPPQRRYWPPSGVAKIRQKNPRMKIMPRKPPCLPAERSVGFRPKFPAPPSGSAKMIRQTTAPNKMIVPPQRRYWPPSGVAKIRQKSPRMKIMMGRMMNRRIRRYPILL